MFPKYFRICFYCLYLRTCSGKASCARPPPTLPQGSAQGSAVEQAVVKEEPKEEAKEEDQTESFSSMFFLGHFTMIENHHEEKQPKNSFTTLLFLPHILDHPLRLNITHSVLLQSQRKRLMSRPRMSDSVQLVFQVLVDVSLGDLTRRRISRKQ